MRLCWLYGKSCAIVSIARTDELVKRVLPLFFGLKCKVLKVKRMIKLSCTIS